MTDRTPDSHEQYVQQLAASIAARLRGVCSHLSDAEFAELVMDIARMKVRFEELDKLPGGLRPLREESESTDE